MLRSVIFTVIISSVFVVNLAGQDCAVKLRNAENQFNAGLVEDVPALLEQCLISGFTDAEELSAYKLIIRSYLFDDKTDMAEQAMMEFLKKYPEYEISPTDHTDFIYLFNKYTVKPVIHFGLHGGINLTYLLGKTSQSLSGIPGDINYFNDKFTIQAGGDIRFKLNDQLEIGLEIDYSEVSFKITEDFLDFGVVEYYEKQRRLEIPLSLYYSPKQYGSFIPYVRGGAGVALNLNSDSRSAFINKDGNNPIPRTGENENRIDLRNKLDFMIAAGIGCKYKRTKGYAFIDISTRMGIRNQIIAGIPENMEWYYFYTDNMFRLNTLKLNLGYVFIIYKPERMEE